MRPAAITTLALLAIGHPGSASPDPSAMELATPDGRIVVTLSPEQAPRHVAAVARSLSSGHGIELRVDRVARGGYVQLAVPGEPTWSDIEHEPGTIGNVRGAVSLYDGPGADPTLLFVLTDSHQLDDDYSPIGWITTGLDAAAAIAARPAGAGGAPADAIALGPLRASTTGDADVGPTSPPRGAASWVIGVSLALTAAAALLHRRLAPRWTTSLLLGAVLIGTFGMFASVLTSADRTPAAGLLALVAVVAVIRLMSRFEPPATDDRPSG